MVCVIIIAAVALCLSTVITIDCYWLPIVVANSDWLYCVSDLGCPDQGGSEENNSWTSSLRQQSRHQGSLHSKTVHEKKNEKLLNVVLEKKKSF